MSKDRPNPIPGQIAYEAYWATMYPQVASSGEIAFLALRPKQQDAWEAAAQAVLDAWQAQREGL